MGLFIICSRFVFKCLIYVSLWDFYYFYLDFSFNLLFVDYSILGNIVLNKLLQVNIDTIFMVNTDYNRLIEVTIQVFLLHHEYS